MTPYAARCFALLSSHFQVNHSKFFSGMALVVARARGCLQVASGYYISSMYETVMPCHGESNFKLKVGMWAC